jgi:hypothetical protein
MAFGRCQLPCSLEKEKVFFANLFQYSPKSILSSKNGEIFIKPDGKKYFEDYPHEAHCNSPD